ncbi:MAG: sulfatase-like hydrolase/transferase [Planctomycetota bacterium]
MPQNAYQDVITVPQPSALVFVLTLAGSLTAQTNTLLIVGDDMGVDTVGVYKEGTAPAPTPNLDKLAANGILFRHAYACPACAPTRATMMTGRYGFRTGVGNVFATLPLAETSLPEVLDKASYAHALIGKWHLGGLRQISVRHPNDTGWKHFAGSLPAYFSSPDTYYSWRKVVNGKASTSKVYATTDNVNDALAWIKSQKGNWVCSVNFNAPHFPFHAPPSSLHTFNLQGKSPSRDKVLFFKAMIQAMDSEIGRLLASIDSATMKKTNVIFIGDNGTDGQVSESPFTRAHAKMTLYEGGWNVPLIVSGPTVKSPGREVKALVHSVDVFDTIAELSGLDARKVVSAGVEIDSISIVPYLTNPNQSPLREFVYTEVFSSPSANSMAIRDKQYKLIVPQRAAAQFYDLVADPFETKDLLRGTLTAAQQEARDRLQAELDRLHGKASWFAFGSGCAGKGSVPALAAATGQRPIYGRTFTTDATGLQSNVTQCLGILGLSRTQFGALKLPLDLTAYKAPGCTLYTGLDFLVPLTAANRRATWHLVIPKDPGLLGLRAYQQVIVFEAGANTHNAILTNAVELTVERQ